MYNKCLPSHVQSYCYDVIFFRVILCMYQKHLQAPFLYRFFFSLHSWKIDVKQETHKSSHLIPKKKKIVVIYNEMIKSFIIGTREAAFRAWLHHSVQFSSVAQSCVFATPWTAAGQASLSITNSQSVLKLMSIESLMPSNHLILCHPLLPPPSVFPSISLFKCVSSSHQVAKILEFQLHQSFQWTPRTYLL